MSPNKIYIFLEIMKCERVQCLSVELKWNDAVRQLYDSNVTVAVIVVFRQSLQTNSM